MVRYIRQNGFVAVEDLGDLSDQSVVAYLYIRLIVE
jgi:putative aminopeptidase FrvX